MTGAGKSNGCHENRAVLGTEIPAFAVGYVLVMSLLGTTLMRYSDRVTHRVVSVDD